MTNKQIMTAQKLLRKLDGTPIRVVGERKTVQVTYELDTYNLLIGLLTDVASGIIVEPGYHRERV